MLRGMHSGHAAGPRMEPASTIPRMRIWGLRPQASAWARAERGGSGLPAGAFRAPAAPAAVCTATRAHACAVPGPGPGPGQYCARRRHAAGHAMSSLAERPGPALVLAASRARRQMPCGQGVGLPPGLARQRGLSTDH